MFLILALLILLETQTYTLKPGDNVAEVLALKGISKETVAQIIASISKEVNLRRCKPEDKLYITTRDGKFIELRYEQSKATWVVDSLLLVSRLPERKLLTHLKGTIETGSLWDALLKVGGTPQLVYKFAEEVFPWDIDFNADTQNGDNFELLTTQEFVGDRFVGYGQILFARYTSGSKEARLKEFTGIYYPKGGSPQRKPGYYDLKGKSLQKTFLRAPIAYVRITSKFSYSRFHPILRIRRPHLGVDYAASTGTPVRSIGEGRAVFVGWRGGFGNQVIVQHSGGFKSYYGHLSRFGKEIRKGKHIKQSQVIGYVGRTGLATGPHLDFRLQKYEKWIDPLKLIPPPIKPLKGKELEIYNEYKRRIFALTAAMECLSLLKPLAKTSFYTPK